MTAVLEIARVQDKVRTFPKWYTEAPVEDSERGRRMDEVRTALLDYPDPEHILRISYGCIGVHMISHNCFESVVEHLGAKGFRFLGNDTKDEYIRQYRHPGTNVDSYSMAYVGERIQP